MRRWDLPQDENSRIEGDKCEFVRRELENRGCCHELGIASKATDSCQLHRPRIINIGKELEHEEHDVNKHECEVQNTERIEEEAQPLFIGKIVVIEA